MRTHSLKSLSLVFSFLFVLSSCGTRPVEVDAGTNPDSGSPVIDAGVLTLLDGGSDDAGLSDAGDFDAGDSDAGSPVTDAGETDAGTVPLDAGLVDSGTFDAGSMCFTCTIWGNPQQSGLVGEPALDELSGLAASRDHAGVLFAHNDSGDTARFFAISQSGAPLGQFTLDGGTAFDWEDMAVGPCPQGSCVYIGDIGDNAMVRTNYAVYRVAEPTVEVTAPVGLVSVPWERFPYQYPNGAKHNAESLVVNPLTGRLYIFTKEASGSVSQVYRFPPLVTPGQMLTLDFVTSLKVPTIIDAQLTAADVAPCGTSVLLRMYNRAVQLTATSGQTFEQMLDNQPTTVAVALEPQGEAIAYSADGRSFFTASEKLTSTVPLSISTCR